MRLTRSESTWQVAWDRSVVEPSLTGGTVLDATTLAGARGDVLGAGGLALVTDRPVVRVGLDKARVPTKRLAAAARTMARLVEIDVAPYVARAKASGDKAFVEAITYRTDDIPADVALNYNTMPGGMLVSDDIPLGPTRGFAAPILGSVGEVTAEMIEEQPDAYEPGDQAGLSGLQQRYDEQLRGSPGVVVDAVASDDKEREGLARRRAAGPPARDHPRPRPAGRCRSGCSPTSARRARWSPCAPATARSSPPPTGRAPVATTWPRSGSSRPARRSRP